MAPQPLDAVISHWSTLIEGFHVSPLAFYDAVEAALARREVPETKNSRIDYKEGGLLSANREYLHVTREKLAFDICGAPFGTGFFVSWWLVDQRPRLNPILRVVLIFFMVNFVAWTWLQMGFAVGSSVVMVLVLGGLVVADRLAAGGDFNDGVLRVIPMIGPLYVWLFKQASYYRIDTMDMFQQAVHNAVLEVIDVMTKDKGIRALSEMERKPIMREFYARKRG